MSNTPRVGAVVIGRNEGDRLKRCVLSLENKVDELVYVDSGSTDDSVEWVTQKGVEVLSLDLSVPFTAARARNSGYESLCDKDNSLDYIFFVDGDCEVCDTWFEPALDFLQNHSDVAVVCGRRCERYPEASVYNRLCDEEWNTAIGEAKACGGDAVMRVQAFNQVSGYRPDLIAGEEPELCLRLRKNGWKIWRIDFDMTIHDAALKHFSQWWKRNERGGYAYFLGALLHGRGKEKFRVRECLRILLWGGALPLFVLLSAVFCSPLTLLLLLAYPLLWAKIFMRAKKQTGWRALASIFLVIGKFPEFIGGMRCLVDALRKKKAQIIEYK